MRLALVTLLVSLGAVTPAAAQAPSPSRTLARWTEAAETDAPPVLDARALLCVNRPWSCECGGLPGAPAPEMRNAEDIERRLLACVNRRVHGAESIGRVEVELSIDRAGRVVRSEVVIDEVRERTLTACVQAALMRLRFEPVAHDDRVLRFPIVFAPPPPVADEPVTVADGPCAEESPCPRR